MMNSGCLQEKNFVNVGSGTHECTKFGNSKLKAQLNEHESLQLQAQPALSNNIFQRRKSYDKLLQLEVNKSNTGIPRRLAPARFQTQDNILQAMKLSMENDPTSKMFHNGGFRTQVGPTYPSSHSHFGAGSPTDHSVPGKKFDASEKEMIPLSPELTLCQLGFNIDKKVDWSKIHLPTKKTIYEHFERRIHNFINTDCVVRIGNEEFNCHLIVLSCYSSYFDNNQQKEYELPEDKVSKSAFHIIYDWMIFREEETVQILDRKNILQVFVAASFLKIKELEEQCWAFIDSQDAFVEETAFVLYLEARKMNCNAVMSLMIQRVMRFFLTLVSSQDFLDLSVEELCIILSSSYISVNSEMEVLLSAVRWLMHDWDNRKVHLCNVMQCVRFGLIEPRALVDIKRNPENPEVIQIMADPTVNLMREDGLSYSIVQYWHNKEEDQFYHWIDMLGLTEPEQRNFTGTNITVTNYNEFLMYLEEIRDKGLDAMLINNASPLINKPLMGKSQSQFNSNNTKIPTMPELLANREMVSRSRLTRKLGSEKACRASEGMEFH